MKFYTGLPPFETFNEVFKFVKDHVDRDYVELHKIDT